MRNINLLLLSNLLTKIGNYSTEVVIFLFALELSGEDYTLIGVIYLIRFIPYIIFGPIGGWLADNFNKKILMLAVEGIRCTLLISLYLLFNYKMINLLSFTFILSLLTVARTVFQPAFQSSIPLLTPEKKLVKVNSTNQILEEIGSLLGPLLTALIITAYTKEIVLIVDALSYLVSFILILFVHFKSSLIPKKTTTIREFSIKQAFDETLNHMNYLLRYDQDLILVITRSALCILCVASLLRFVLPAYVLELTGSETLVSYSFSALAFGTIIGGLTFSKLNLKITASNTMKAWSIYGLLFCALAVITEIKFTILVLIILGFVGAFVDILLVSFIQKKSDDNNIGKNFSLFSTLANTGESASGILGGFLAAISLKYSLITLSSFVIVIPLINTANRKKHRDFDKAQ
ncbi:MFS transporter [Vibrio sp. NTOU-M3]|uniref:MFS transporter n=1 Tax=Vibrio sp. NTOU-M3 TaxID=3234954 RepID=UPI00349F83A9